MGKWFLGLLNVILFFAVGWHTVLGYGFSIKGGRVWGSNFSSHLSSFFPSPLLISNILSPDLPIALTADCWSSRPAVTRGWFWVVTIVTLAASSPTPTPPLNHGKRPCVELFCWLFRWFWNRFSSRCSSSSVRLDDCKFSCSTTLLSLTRIDGFEGTCCVCRIWLKVRPWSSFVC